MIVFLDFEASSLGRHGFPIEVGWAGEDGSAESHLIRPAPSWEDWAESAERVHAISLERLRQDGTRMRHSARRHGLCSRRPGCPLPSTAISSKMSLMPSGKPRNRKWLLIERSRMPSGSYASGKKSVIGPSWWRRVGPAAQSGSHQSPMDSNMGRLIDKLLAALIPSLNALAGSNRRKLRNSGERVLCYLPGNDCWVHSIDRQRSPTSVRGT